MKFNTFFVAAICAGALMTSCDYRMNDHQLKFTHMTLADGDAYAFFQVVGETALDGVKYAEYAENSGDAKAAEVAGKVKAYYNQLLPSLDSLATQNHVDFPIKGIPQGHADTDSTAVDSVANTQQVAHAHFDYVQHAQHEIATVKERLKRLSRNTNGDLKDFAKHQYDLVSHLFTEIGGKEDAQAHH